MFFVLYGVLPCQHYDRGIAVPGPILLTDFHSALAWHLPVENDQVVFQRKQIIESIYTIIDGVYPVLLELGQAAYLRFVSGFPAEKRDAVQDATSNLVAQGKTLGFALRFPFDEIAKWRISHCGAPYRAEPRNGATFILPRVPEAASRAPPNVGDLFQVLVRENHAPGA